MHFADSEDNRKRLQQALRPYGYDGEIDGVLGAKSKLAIRTARASLGLGSELIIDDALLVKLGLRAPDRKPNPFLSLLAGIAVNAVLPNLLKGSNMDFARVSKAIAAAISGAGIGGGSTVYTYIQIPPEQLAALPGWLSMGLPFINGAIGAIAAFCIVYFAPANKAS